MWSAHESSHLYPTAVNHFSSVMRRNTWKKAAWEKNRGNSFLRFWRLHRSESLGSCSRTPAAWSLFQHLSKGHFSHLPRHAASHRSEATSCCLVTAVKKLNLDFLCVFLRKRACRGDWRSHQVRRVDALISDSSPLWCASWINFAFRPAHFWKPCQKTASPTSLTHSTERVSQRHSLLPPVVLRLDVKRIAEKSLTIWGKGIKEEESSCLFFIKIPCLLLLFLKVLFFFLALFLGSRTNFVKLW